MPDPNPDAMRFLLTRRSRPAKTIGPPYPDPDTITRLLTAAARAPDHGKLEPWRFVVVTGAATDRLAEMIAAIGPARGHADADIGKMADQFARSGCAVAVIECPRDQAKVPAIEQTYSAGAVALGLVNAALAEGWAANWLTGWAAYDSAFAADGLGVWAPERIVGFVHLGTETVAPPERPRPDIAAITTWLTE